MEDEKQDLLVEVGKNWRKQNISVVVKRRKNEVSVLQRHSMVLLEDIQVVLVR